MAFYLFDQYKQFYLNFYNILFHKGFIFNER